MRVYDIVFIVFFLKTIFRIVANIVPTHVKHERCVAIIKQDDVF